MTLNFSKKAGICFLFSVSFLLGASPCVFAQNFVKPPNTLLVEGDIAIPKEAHDEFERYAQYNDANFLGWQEDGTLIGYDQYFNPFFLDRALGKRRNIDYELPDFSSFTLQPKAETQFLFTKDQKGNELAQLFAYDLRTRKATQLTRYPEIEFVSSHEWSSSGTKVFFTNRRQGNNTTEVYELTPQTKKKRLLTVLNTEVYYISTVSSDSIVFWQYINNNHTRYFRFNLKSKKLTQLTEETAYYKNAKYSIDGTGVWWLSDVEGEFFNLYFYDFATGRKKVNKVAYNISGFSFSPDENLLALKINQNGAEKIKIFNMSGKQIEGELSEIKTELGVINRFSWRNNKELGYDFQSPKSPSEIRVFNTETGVQDVWSKSKVIDEDIKNLEVELITWKSFDDREITGFILKPKLEKNSKKKLPVFIDIHGGPKNQYQPIFYSADAYFASTLKVAIVFPNIRGSSGFGKEFENLDNKEKREDAVKDLQALLDWIETQPNLNKRKVIAKGTSYGGFMSLALGTKEQRRLKGVIAEVPLISIKDYLAKSFKGRKDRLEWEYRSLNNEGLIKTSEKLSLLHQDALVGWKIPVLLTAGRNDSRVSFESINRLKTELMRKKIRVWFLKAENEGHFWSDYDNNLYLKLAKIVFAIRLGFFPT